MTKREKQQLILRQMGGKDNSTSWAHWHDTVSDAYEDFIHAGSRPEALELISDLDLLMSIVSCKTLTVIPMGDHKPLNYDIPFLIKRLLREDEEGDQLVLIHSILARIRIHAESYGFRDEELDAAWMERYNEMIAE